MTAIDYANKPVTKLDSDIGIRDDDSVVLFIQAAGESSDREA